MKRLILDLDDTMGDLLTPWLEMYNKGWGDNLQRKDITDWNVGKFAKPECGNRIYQFLEPTVTGYSLWNDMKPLDGAVEALGVLSEKMEIFVVSSVTGNYRICEYKDRWLRKYFPFLDPKKFYFVSDKSGVYGDFFVDDNYKNFKGFNGMKILFDCPHNANIKVADGINVRVHNWDELFTMLLVKL